MRGQEVEMQIGDHFLKEFSHEGEENYMIASWKGQMKCVYFVLGWKRHGHVYR